MKKLLTITLLLLTTLCFAQQSTGIQFVHNLSWEQIKAKARAENRYIFLDAYTTWCGPCKQMARDIFPLKEVGDFYNANFLNVKVQIDTTKNDDNEVKAWYQDAQNISRTYNIRAYPTYLFLNPQGELVHRIVGGRPADAFIAKAKDAMDPDKQYFTLKRQYVAGKKDPEFLFKLIGAANEAYESEFVPVVARDYFSTVTDLNKPEIIKLLPYATSKTSDAGFAFFMNNPAAADSILGKGTSARTVKSIIFNEEVVPQLRSGETKQQGAMLFYTGELKNDVNWPQLKKNLEAKYPQFSDVLYLRSRKSYFEWKKDLPNFALAMDEYITKFPDELNKYELNNSAWWLFEKSDDPEALKSALAWSKKTLEGETAKEVMFMDTYANLLYKTGKKQEALALETEAVKLSGEKDENGDLHKVLDKMKRGEKTW